MTVDVGVVEQGEIILGHDLAVQAFTISGGPTSGTMTFSMLDETTTPVSIADSAATINAAINALSSPCAQTAVFAWTTSTTFTITSGSKGSFVEPWRVQYTFAGGADPEIAPPTISERHPLFYTIAGDAGTFTAASVPPTVGKQAVPGSVADRSDQPKVSEWFGRSWLPGLGRLHYRENESTERFWDSSVWTHVDRQVTLPALVQSETLNASAGTPMAVTNYKVGVTVNGVRAVAMFDATGLMTAGTPVYWDSTAGEWKIIPSALTLTSDTSICGIIFYGGMLYMTYYNVAQTKRGYLVWDGSTSNCTTVDTADQYAVLDWEEWGGKLFRLLGNGKIQYGVANYGTALLTDATDGSDWKPVTNTPRYMGPGYAYALKNFTDRSGALITHIIATDGLYTLNFETWEILRVKEVNGPSVLVPGVYPQPNSVTEHNGDLYWIHGDSTRKYDGQVISDVGPMLDDGLPERGLAFTQALRPRALFSTNNMLFCAMSTRVENVAATTLAVNTTLLADTTYYTTLTLSGTTTLGVGNIALTDPSTVTLYILDAADNAGCVLGFNGQGWHTIVPLTASTTAAPFTTRAVLYHEIHQIPRLLFAPGRYVRWRDKPGNPIFWGDMLWDTTAARWLVTSWFDLDLTDIPKLLLYLRQGHHQLGGGATITTYYQINGTADRSDPPVGSDPAVSLVQLLDATGAATVAGSTGEPINAVSKLYFERDTAPTLWSRGKQAREVRLIFKLASSNSAITPVMDFFSTVLTAKFQSLFSYPIQIQITAQGDKDGRSAERQVNDLMATYLSNELVAVAIRPDSWRFVDLDFFNGQGFSTGTAIDASRPPVVGLTLSEITRF